MTTTPSLAVLLATLSAACSSVSGGGPGDASADGDPSRSVGTFQVRLVAPVPAEAGEPATAGYTAIVGKVYDGPTPEPIVWEEAARAGACRLLTPRVPFCGKPCGGSAVCVENDTCQMYPMARSVGTVTVKGVRATSGETSFAMTPIANNYQPPAGLSLPFPAFAEGDEIRLDASGGAFSPFALAARGVAPLELASTPLRLDRERALGLVWTPPGQPALSKVHVKLDISHHGGTKGMIACDADDAGSLELPASLVTALLDLGTAGFPTVIVTRSASGSAVIAAGRVDLVVSSEVERAVDVPGVISCNADDQCPPGTTCRTDLTCK